MSSISGGETGRQWAAGLAAQSRHDPVAGQGHQFDLARDAGFEAHRGAGRDGEPVAPGGVAVEVSAALASAKW